MRIFIGLTFLLLGIVAVVVACLLPIVAAWADWHVSIQWLGAGTARGMGLFCSTASTMAFLVIVGGIAFGRARYFLA